MEARASRGTDQLYVDGEWRSVEETMAVRDLTTGDAFTRVPAATPTEVDEALAAAERAQEPLRESTIVQRVAWLEAIADGIERRADELAECLVREAGKPISSARSEVASAAERFRRAVDEARDFQGESLEGTTESHEGWRAIVRPEPVGTVLCIVPYNYPVLTGALQVAPALAAGNSVVLKPASQTPASALVLAEIVDEASRQAETPLPDGAFNVVTGRSRDVGDALAGDDRVDAIAMTGSSDAGEHVADTSGMTTLHMELGGNAPAIVFPDADLDEAAGACVKGSLKYAGQRCSAVSRVLVHEDVHDSLAAAVDDEMDDWHLGDLFDEDTALGPVISEEHAEYVEEIIDDAVRRGATLVRGGERDGAAVEPTLLTNVPQDARVVSEEQFGPVVALVPVADEEEAIAVGNSGDLGLDGSVFTRDYDRAFRVADALRVGAVRINGAPSHGLGDVPFGGFKRSGIGREGIGYTAEAFTTTKSIVL